MLNVDIDAILLLVKFKNYLDKWPVGDFWLFPIFHVIFIEK